MEIRVKIRVDGRTRWSKRADVQARSYILAQAGAVLWASVDYYVDRIRRTVSVASSPAARFFGPALVAAIKADRRSIFAQKKDSLGRPWVDLSQRTLSRRKLIVGGPDGRTRAGKQENRVRSYHFGFSSARMSRVDPANYRKYILEDTGDLRDNFGIIGGSNMSGFGSAAAGRQVRSQRFAYKGKTDKWKHDFILPWKPKDSPIPVMVPSARGPQRARENTYVSESGFSRIDREAIQPFFDNILTAIRDTKIIIQKKAGELL